MTWLALGGWLAAACLAVTCFVIRGRLELVERAEHELRGPLGTLALAVEQVRRKHHDSDLAGQLEAQLDRSRAGLADLRRALAGSPRWPARIPPGSTELCTGATRQPVRVERLARHTAAGWSSVAGREGRTVRVDWRAGPVTVATDRGRLAQAFGNLLSNAIEHGRGDVEVRGRRVGRVLRVEVADAGRSDRLGARTAPGTRPAAGAAVGPQMERSPGTGLASRRTPPEPRRGLGLAIAASAVEQAGGSLEITTGPAETTAALELPIEER